MAVVSYTVTESNYKSNNTFDVNVDDEVAIKVSSTGIGNDRWGLYRKSPSSIPLLTWHTVTAIAIIKGDKNIYRLGKQFDDDPKDWATQPGVYKLTKGKLAVTYIGIGQKGSLKKGGTLTLNVNATFKSKIIFDKKGGTGGPEDEILTKKIPSPTYSFYYIVPYGSPTKNGYEFLGWAASSTKTTVDYRSGSIIYVPGSYTKNIPETTLYAVWEIYKWYLKLNYNANGGTGAPSSYSTVTPRETATTVTINIPNTKPTRAGYVFKGWSKSSSATKPSYQPGGTIQLTETRDSNYANVLYAVWNKIYTSTLRYDAVGGTGAPDDDVLSTNSINQPADGVHTISNVVPTLDKYKFKGWNTIKYEKGKGKPTLFAGDKITVPYYITTTPTILYAVWRRKCSMYAKHDGEWKEGILFAKVNGEWKEVEEAFAKKDGEWKQ